MRGPDATLRAARRCFAQPKAATGLADNWRFEYRSTGNFQDYDPFLGTLNVRCRIIVGIQKGTIVLTTSYTGFISLIFRVSADNARFEYIGFRVLGLSGARALRVWGFGGLEFRV